jgi:hypothetical protein
MKTLTQLADDVELLRQRTEKDVSEKQKLDAEVKLAKATKNVPVYVEKVITELLRLTQDGHRKHEITYWDSSDAYLVSNLIAEKLRKGKNKLTVIEDTYYSQGSYGDCGEIFVESSRRKILKISW